MQEISSKPDTLVAYLRKLWLHRYLIIVFAKRDLKVKYAQTFLGVAWTLVYPATAVLVYTVFFSSILHIEAQYPYVLFVLSGVLCWGIFSYVFNQASTGLYNAGGVLKKMQYPKIIIPFSKCILAFVEFVISFLFFVLLLFIYNQAFSWKWILLPLAIIPVLFAALGGALLMSAASVKKRDLLYISPFIVNFSIWFTPVFYPVNILPERYKFLINMNPITSSINFFRNFFFNEPLDLFSYLGVFLSLVLFILGLFFFKSIEEKINDML